MRGFICAQNAGDNARKTRIVYIEAPIRKDLTLSCADIMLRYINYDIIA